MEVLLFGIARDIVGKSSFKITVEEKTPNTVLELKKLLSKNYPEFKKLSSLAVAVNSEYAANEAAIASADEIAIIPPVSGG